MVLTLAVAYLAGKEMVSAVPTSLSVTQRIPVLQTPIALSCPAAMNVLALLVIRAMTPSMLTVLTLTSVLRVTSATRTPAAATASAHTLAHVTLATMATDVFALMMMSVRWVLTVALVLLSNVRMLPARTNATAQTATQRTQTSCLAMSSKSHALI
jgi:hypothetical protein